MAQDLITVIDAKKGSIQKVLPPNVKLERFIAAAKTAILTTPGLNRCDPHSTIISLMKCANDGLIPDGREAALIVFRTKTDNRWVDKCQYIPMVAGLLKKMRRSGQILGVEPRVVYEHDEFDLVFGTEPRIHHKPKVSDKGAPIGCYAVFTFVNGSKYVEWMDNDEVNGIMMRSKSVNRESGEVMGPWKTDYTEMMRKTVLKRAMKVLPTEAVADDDDAEDETVWKTEEYWPPQGVEGIQLGLEATPEEEAHWQGVVTSTRLSLGVCTTRDEINKTFDRILADFEDMPQAVRAELNRIRDERLYRLETD
jgi:recombination protein RecT